MLRLETPGTTTVCVLSRMKVAPTTAILPRPTANLMRLEQFASCLPIVVSVPVSGQRSQAEKSQSQWISLITAAHWSRGLLLWARRSKKTCSRIHCFKMMTMLSTATTWEAATTTSRTMAWMYTNTSPEHSASLNSSTSHKSSTTTNWKIAIKEQTSPIHSTTNHAWGSGNRTR